MKKKKSSSEKRILTSKLKHYSALAVSVVSLDAAGQVVYTNINDTTLVNNGDYFDIDLNSDGILEGRIEYLDITSSYSTSSSFKLNGAVVDSLSNASINVSSTTFSTTGSSTSSTYVAAALNLNDNINNNLNNWSNGSSSTSTSSSVLNGVIIGADAIVTTSSSTYSTNIGKFPGQKDKFLGVKFTIGTSTHYGWLRLDMSLDADSITIKDFAYESSPNTAISAGDTGNVVGLSRQNLKDKFDYFASNGRITINSKLTANSILSIYDLSGKLVQSEMIGLQNEVSVQGNLQGIYIVEIRNSTGVSRKKLWLETR